MSAVPSGQGRAHGSEARTERVTVRLSKGELAVVETHAKQQGGLAVSSYMALAALRGDAGPEQLPLELVGLDEEARLVRVLLGLQRELREAVAAGSGPVIEAVADQLHQALLAVSRR